MRSLPRLVPAALAGLAGTLLLVGCTGEDNTKNSPSDAPVTTTTSLPGPTDSGSPTGSG